MHEVGGVVNGVPQVMEVRSAEDDDFGVFEVAAAVPDRGLHLLREEAEEDEGASHNDPGMANAMIVED